MSCASERKLQLMKKEEEEEVKVVKKRRKFGAEDVLPQICKPLASCRIAGY
jgi:hypothetical protein